MRPQVLNQQIGVPMIRAIGVLTMGAVLAGSPAYAGIIVTQTTDPTTLAGALGGSGLTINSISIANGDVNQFGVYRNFSLLRPGVVLSSGNAIDTMGPPVIDDLPSTDLGQPGTSEFDAYGPGNITNFTNSNDVAALQVDFTLANSSGIAFDFIFGSIEYPNWVSSYTDSLLIFLDGKLASNQITFDSAHLPVQVGSSFASKIILSNSETAFGDPHGFIPALTTTTGTLGAGQHRLLFEVGDVNDHILDSAAFITNFRATQGTDSGDDETEFVPEPSSLTMLGTGALCLLGFWRFRRKTGN